MNSVGIVGGSILTLHYQKHFTICSPKLFVFLTKIVCYLKVFVFFLACVYFFKNFKKYLILFFLSVLQTTPLRSEQKLREIRLPAVQYIFINFECFWLAFSKIENFSFLRKRKLLLVCQVFSTYEWNFSGEEGFSTPAFLTSSKKLFRNFCVSSLSTENCWDSLFVKNFR